MLRAGTRLLTLAGSGLAARRALSTARCEPVAPAVTLFVYEVCPYCCFTRAVLDAHAVPYATVEVNPLTKAEIKAEPALGDDYRLVPIALVDGEQVNGSRAIVERVLPAAAAAQDARTLAACEWAHERFVKLLPANLYRNLPEAFEAFDYISEHQSFSPWQQASIRYTGTAFMWALQGRMKKKYGIGDEREDLYAAGRHWMALVGEGAAFHGGSAPDMADLTVYGMCNAMANMTTLADLLAQDGEFEAWFRRVREWVGRSGSAGALGSAA